MKGFGWLQHVHRWHTDRGLATTLERQNEMKLQGSTELFQYWNRLRDGRPAPQRTEIEPADIKSLLADTFILELDARGAAVFRLAGTRLCATHGRELKGFTFASLWIGRDQAMIARLYNAAFTDKTVICVTYQGHTDTQRQNEFELLLLPLSGGRESPRCLGIVSAATRPFWLGADPIHFNVVDTVRVIDADLEPMFLKNRPAVEVPSLAPGSRHLTDLREPNVAGRRIRHLVVFDGGREG